MADFQLVEVVVFPKFERFDPHAKVAEQRIRSSGIEGIRSVKVGRVVQMMVYASNDQEMRSKVMAACKSVLVNEEVEEYTFRTF